MLLTLDLSDPTTAKVLAPDPKTGKSKGARADNDYAVAWIKTVGQGRVFYCSLGHNGSVFENPAVVGFYLDGIQFALGDLNADATPKPNGTPKNCARQAAMPARFWAVGP